MGAPGGGNSGGGSKVGGPFLAARGPYGRCAGVGGGGGLWCVGGQPLRTALQTIIISLQKGFCEPHNYLDTSELKNSKST